MNRKYTITPEESKRRSAAMKEKVRPARLASTDKIAGKKRATLITIGREHENLIAELRNRIIELEGQVSIANSRLQRLDNAENILKMHGLDTLL